MKTVHTCLSVALLALVAGAIVACATPGILGGATTETTKTLCADGSRCDNPYVCPAYAGKPCEAPSAPPTAWGAAPSPDAGTR